MIKIKPEEKTEIIIATWLLSKGFNVWFNRHSKLFDNVFVDYNIFKIKGTNNKPDMIFKKINGCFNYVLELKSPEKNINIINATKINKYCEDYIQNKSSYIIENKDTDIDFFLVGTDNSPKGHLFNIEELETNKIIKSNNMIIPPFEYSKSKLFLRTLWKLFNNSKENKKVHIGLLLSDVLNNRDIVGVGFPSIFSQVYNKKWTQYWSQCR